MDTASTLVANLARVINLESSPSGGPSTGPEPGTGHNPDRSAVSAAYESDQNGSPHPPSRSLALIEPDQGTVPDQVVASTETAVSEDQLNRRVTEMCQAVSSGSASADSTAQWLRLLKEINDLHNAGELSTDTFRQMNTQLLSVLEEPPDD